MLKPDPFEEGYEYCIDGGYMEDNPYIIYSSDWYSWNDGFNNASIEPISFDDYYDNEDYVDEDRPY